MKKIAGWTGLTISIGLLMLVACSKDSGSSPTGPSTACSEAFTGSKCSVKACSDGNKAWYETSTGTKYNCSSTNDCSSAAQAAVNACY